MAGTPSLSCAEVSRKPTQQHGIMLFCDSGLPVLCTSTVSHRRHFSSKTLDKAEHLPGAMAPDWGWDRLCAQVEAQRAAVSSPSRGGVFRPAPRGGRPKAAAQPVPIALPMSSLAAPRPGTAAVAAVFGRPGQGGQAAFRPTLVPRTAHYSQVGGRVPQRERDSFPDVGSLP